MSAGIYFVQFAQYLKIGHTGNFVRRFASLRALALDESFVVLGVRLCGNRPTKEHPFAGWVARGAEEQRIHGIFKPWNISGDWFMLCGESLTLVGEYAVPYVPPEKVRKSRVHEGMLLRREVLFKRLQSESK